MSGEFTVPELLADMGFCHDDKTINWPLGAAIREAYRKKYHRLPSKVLGPKTRGLGSHCFAAYPEGFRPDAERIVLEKMANADRQMGLSL